MSNMEPSCCVETVYVARFITMMSITASLFAISWGPHWYENPSNDTFNDALVNYAPLKIASATGAAFAIPVFIDMTIDLSFHGFSERDSVERLLLLLCLVAFYLSPLIFVNRIDSAQVYISLTCCRNIVACTSPFVILHQIFPSIWRPIIMLPLLLLWCAMQTLSSYILNMKVTPLVALLLTIDLCSQLVVLLVAVVLVFLSWRQVKHNVANRAISSGKYLQYAKQCREEAEAKARKKLHRRRREGSGNSSGFSGELDDMGGYRVFGCGEECWRPIRATFEGLISTLSTVGEWWEEELCFSTSFAHPPLNPLESPTSRSPSPVPSYDGFAGTAVSRSSTNSSARGLGLSSSRISAATRPNLAAPSLPMAAFFSIKNYSRDDLLALMYSGAPTLYFLCSGTYSYLAKNEYLVSRRGGYDMTVLTYLHGILLVFMLFLPSRMAHFDVVKVHEALDSKTRLAKHVHQEMRTPLNIVVMGLELLTKAIESTAPPPPSGSGSAHLHAPLPQSQSRLMTQSNVPGGQQEEGRDTNLNIVARQKALAANLEDLQDLLGNVSTSCFTAIEVLNDMLVYEKIDASLSSLTLALNLHPVEPFVHQIMQPFSIQAKQKGIRLQLVNKLRPIAADGIKIVRKHTAASLSSSPTPQRMQDGGNGRDFLSPNSLAASGAASVNVSGFATPQLGGMAQKFWHQQQQQDCGMNHGLNSASRSQAASGVCSRRGSINALFSGRSSPLPDGAEIGDGVSHASKGDTVGGALDEEADFARRFHCMRIDPVKMGQAIRNFLSNALKFTPKNGAITVVIKAIPGAGASGGAGGDVTPSPSRPQSPNGAAAGYSFGLKSISATSASDAKSAGVGAADVENPPHSSSQRSGSASSAPVASYGIDPRHPRVRISVVDTGAGISAANISRLFHDVVQFDANELQGGGGSGFGLQITKGIVEKHSGTVGVTSNGVGNGSTFFLDLPLYTYGASMGAAAAPDTQSEVPPGVTVKVNRNGPAMRTADEAMHAVGGSTVCPMSEGVAPFMSEAAVDFDGPHEQHQQQQEPVTPAPPTRVLIVDRSQISRRMLCKLLKSFDTSPALEVDVVGSGEECVERLLSFKMQRHKRRIERLLRRQPPRGRKVQFQRTNIVEIGNKSTVSEFSPTTDISRGCNHGRQQSSGRSRGVGGVHDDGSRGRGQGSGHANSRLEGNDTLGAEVEEAEGEGEGVDEGDEDLYDVVILDNMHGLSGPETAALLRRSFNFRAAALAAGDADADAAAADKVGGGGQGHVEDASSGVEERRGLLDSADRYSHSPKGADSPHSPHSTTRTRGGFWGMDSSPPRGQWDGGALGGNSNVATGNHSPSNAFGGFSVTEPLGVDIGAAIYKLSGGLMGQSPRVVASSYAQVQNSNSFSNTSAAGTGVDGAGSSDVPSTGGRFGRKSDPSGGAVGGFLFGTGRRKSDPSGARGNKGKGASRERGDGVSGCSFSGTIICIGGVTDDQVEADFLAAGVDAVLDKPVVSADLLRRLHPGDIQNCRQRRLVQAEEEQLRLQLHLQAQSANGRARRSTARSLSSNGSFSYSENAGNGGESLAGRGGGDHNGGAGGSGDTSDFAGSDQRLLSYGNAGGHSGSFNSAHRARRQSGGGRQSVSPSSFASASGGEGVNRAAAVGSIVEEAVRSSNAGGSGPERRMHVVGVPMPQGRGASSSSSSATSSSSKSAGVAIKVPHLEGRQAGESGRAQRDADKHRS